ncbi:ferredoxin [Nocardiopsis coralliicola]
MAVREDERLRDGPMQPVDCGACGASVYARKASWAQTSVQWTQEAARTCRELPPPGGAADSGGRAACGALRSAIREAAVTGALTVQQDAG